MRRMLLTTALLALSFTALGQSSIRVGMRLISTGDSSGKVLNIAGRPDRVVQLENPFSANIGERWEYYTNSKTVQFVFTDGVLKEIKELYN